MQLSDDRQQLYYGILNISKHRKFSYYVSKIIFSDFMRAKLVTMVERLAQLKATKQKTPITTEEGLEKLEAESERDMLLLVRDLEQFFDPMT